MARDTYHHGDLKRALLTAGMAAARTAGPDAVSLREVARACGVTVPAIYRHYADRHDFLSALARAAQAELAARIDAAAGDATGAALLHTVGVEYVRFALAEPGWFATAFTVPPDLQRAMDPEAAAGSGRTPFQLLNLALDQMLDAGVVTPQRRQGAEVACWSAVHGLAVLVTSGPLRFLPVEQVDALVPYVVDVGVRGVSGA